MNILIAGLGALGTVFGALLGNAGHTVHALTKEKYLAALRDRTLRVTGIWGDHDAVLDGVHASVGSIAAMNFDLIVLAVKSFDTAATVDQIKTLVGRDTLLLVAQNGYGNYEIVSGEIGKDHTLLGRVIFGAKLLAPGRSEVTVIADDVRIGQPDHAVPDDRVQAIASAIRAAGIPASFDDAVYAVLWDKILYNCALNPLDAILACTYGELARSEHSRALMDRIIVEIFLVARARGIRLNWKSPEEYLSHFYSALVPPTAAHYPSMHYDLKSGKRTEIDALNGAMVRLAAGKGLAVPVNDTITRIIKAKESPSLTS